MSWNLFIDDERNPVDVFWGETKFRRVYPWFIARNLKQVQDYIDYKGFPTFISFDHDLGKDQPTGMDIAKWLIELDLNEDAMPFLFDFYVHSKNPVGKQNIESLMNNYIKSKPYND